MSVSGALSGFTLGPLCDNLLSFNKLENSLETVMKMRPVSFKWKEGMQKQQKEIEALKEENTILKTQLQLEFLN